MANYITKEGKEKLEKELDHLKNNRRGEVRERIRNAAAMGDLSENFDYSDAKEEQEFIERRIAEIEQTLHNAEVVDEKRSGEAVQMGSEVTLKTGSESFTVTITGPQEADPLKDKISAESPLGAALLGKAKGEKVEVETPNGTVTYAIKEIS